MARRKKAVKRLIWSFWLREGCVRMRWTHFFAQISGNIELNSLNRDENFEEATLDKIKQSYESSWTPGDLRLVEASDFCRTAPITCLDWFQHDPEQIQEHKQSFHPNENKSTPLAPEKETNGNYVSHGRADAAKFFIHFSNRVRNVQHVQILPSYQLPHFLSLLLDCSSIQWATDPLFNILGFIDNLANDSNAIVVEKIIPISELQLYAGGFLHLVCTNSRLWNKQCWATPLNYSSFGFSDVRE